MSHAVPSPDSSLESFARLLHRLTQSPNANSNDEDVRVSLSDRGTALSNGRKRAMAPVRILTQSSSKRSAEATEISYERALRLHSHNRTIEPPLSKSDTAAYQEAPVSRANELQKPLPLSGRRRSTARGPGTSTRLPAAASSYADTSKNVQSSKQALHSSSPHHSAIPQVVKKKKRSEKLTAAAVPSRPAGSAASPSPKIRGQKNAPQIVATAKPVRSPVPGQTQKHSDRRAARKFRVQPELPETLPANLAAPSLELELASRLSALTQRHSIVSIRLNAIESDQLRQRAVESGLSVSAYMRSCVLDAEHLRSQVKEALAQIRSPQAVAQLSELPTLPDTVSPSKIMRGGFWGFLSGISALILSRWQR